MGHSVGSYLQEHLAKNPVCLFPEHSRKDDGDTIRRCLDVDRLFVPIMNSQEVPLPGARSGQFLLRGEG